MKMRKVIEVLTYRRGHLVDKMAQWSGPLTMGLYPFWNAEKVALDHAIELAGREMKARQISTMDAGEAMP